MPPARHERSEYLAFCYSHIPNALSGRAMTTPNLQVVTGDEAILAVIRVAWKAPQEEVPNLWQNGKLALCEFENLASYLARSTSRGVEPEEVSVESVTAQSASG
jgi:hypothetical protein